MAAFVALNPSDELANFANRLVIIHHLVDTVEHIFLDRRLRLDLGSSKGFLLRDPPSLDSYVPD